jgi:hypothetical protein
VVYDSTGSLMNSRAGDLKIETVLPTANGTYMAWSNVGGANQHATLADTLGAPDDDTSYITDGTSGDKSTCTFVSISSTPTYIYGANVKTRLKKTDVGTVNFAATCKSSSTNSDGTTTAATTSYAWYSQLYAGDPNTSALWTKSNLTAAEFGVKVI